MEDLPLIKIAGVPTAKIKRRLEAYKKADAPNTAKAKSFDYKVYEQWCEEHHVTKIPIDPEHLELFLWDMAGTEVTDENGNIVYDSMTGLPELVENRAVATVERYLFTVRYMHNLHFQILNQVSDNPAISSEIKNPADSEIVKIAMKGIRRRFKHKAQRQAAPIRLATVDKIITELDNSLRHTLYKALISVGFDSMMRCSELVRIEMDHLNYHDDGSGSVFVPFHKTDQHGKGGYRYLSKTSVGLIREWCSMTGINQGLLFRSVKNGNSVLSAMHKDRVAAIYKYAAQKCGLVAKDISAHSTRVGAAQELLVNGATLPGLMVAGDWTSPEMPVRYSKKIAVETGAMADLAKLKGRS